TAIDRSLVNWGRSSNPPAATIPNERCHVMRLAAKLWSALLLSTLLGGCTARLELAPPLGPASQVDPRPQSFGPAILLTSATSSLPAADNTDDPLAGKAALSAD